MPYDVKVRCDNEECKKSVAVPQVGSLPDPDWIIITRAVPKMVKSHPGAEAPDTIQPEVIKFVVCSATCGIAILKPVADGEASKAGSPEVAQPSPRRRRRR